MIDQIKKGANNFATYVKKIIDDFFKWLEDLFRSGKADEVFEFVGSGGNLKYLKILSRNMVAQEHSMSCAAACIRQLAKDQGIEITEEAVRKLAGTTKQFGTYEKGMSYAAKAIFKDAVFGEGTIDHIPLATKELVEVLTKKKPFIAWIRETSNGVNHAVIVNKFENGLIFIKDPWPLEGIGKGKGIVATIKLDDFDKVWSRTGKYTFWFKN